MNIRDWLKSLGLDLMIKLPHYGDGDFIAYIDKAECITRIGEKKIEDQPAGIGPSPELAVNRLCAELNKCTGIMFKGHKDVTYQFLVPNNLYYT